MGAVPAPRSSVRAADRRRPGDGMLPRSSSPRIHCPAEPPSDSSRGRRLGTGPAVRPIELSVSSARRRTAARSERNPPRRTAAGSISIGTGNVVPARAGSGRAARSRSETRRPAERDPRSSVLASNRLSGTAAPSRFAGGPPGAPHAGSRAEARDSSTAREVCSPSTDDEVRWRGRRARNARAAAHPASRRSTPRSPSCSGKELERQRGQIELIASENFTWPSVLRGRRQRADEQVRRGLSGQAVLRRLRGRRRDRADRDRPREVPLRRRARERPAARGRPDEHGRLHGRAPAGRHDPLARALPRRPPDARAQGQLLGPAVHDRPLRREPRDEHGRLRRGARAREGAQAEADHLRRLGLSAHGRDGQVPRDRRRGRCPAPL